jgi:hypothetical protein
MLGEKTRLRDLVKQLAGQLDDERDRRHRHILRIHELEVLSFQQHQRIADLEVQLASTTMTIAKVRSAVADLPLVGTEAKR